MHLLAKINVKMYLKMSIMCKIPFSHYFPHPNIMSSLFAKLFKEHVSQHVVNNEACIQMILAGTFPAKHSAHNHG